MKYSAPDQIAAPGEGLSSPVKLEARAPNTLGTLAGALLATHLLNSSMLKKTYSPLSTMLSSSAASMISRTVFGLAHSTTTATQEGAGFVLVCKLIGYRDKGHSIDRYRLSESSSLQRRETDERMQYQTRGRTRYNISRGDLQERGKQQLRKWHEQQSKSHYIPMGEHLWWARSSGGHGQRASTAARPGSLPPCHNTAGGSGAL